MGGVRASVPGGAGFGIALDDIGADRRPLALLPLLRPDVVKLGMTLIRTTPAALPAR